MVQTPTGHIGTSLVERYLGSKRTAFARQEASPAPEQEHLGLPHGERTFTMFVQTAKGGTWEPKEGEEGTYTLTLTGLPAQTVYFSDRPQRIVGTQSTVDFLRALGFGEENPPNAALVTKDEDGADDILVIELFNPVYTPGDGAEGATLVYEAKVLANYHETHMGGVALEQDDTAIPSSFDGASLFIDDCSNARVECWKGGVLEKQIMYGCCYSFPGCYQCSETAGLCETVDSCKGGRCTLTYAWECFL